MNVTIKSTDTIYSMHPAQEDAVVYNLKHAFKISIKQQQTNCKQQQNIKQWDKPLQLLE